MRAHSQPSDALLLRSATYGEADRVITLLTREHGKIACIARGARKSRHRFAGRLEPLCRLRVSLEHGRGPLPSLAASELVRHYPRLLADLERMDMAFRGIELLRELCPEHVPEPELLELGFELLETLEGSPLSPPAVLACFELRLLALSGFAPRLAACGVCGKQARSEQSARFDPVAGHLVCRACGGASKLLSAPLRSALAQAERASLAQGACGLGAHGSVALDALSAFAEHRVGHALHARAMTLRHGDKA